VHHSGKGKKKAYELVIKENNNRKAMMDLGELFNTSDNTFAACERFAPVSMVSQVMT
jgi:hypothetical protein